MIGTDGSAVIPGDDYRLPGYQFGTGANALVMMNRVAFYEARTGKLHEPGKLALLRWASEFGLGQEMPAEQRGPGKDAEDLVRSAAARRERAVAALRHQGHHVTRLRAEPEWRLAVGLGNKANAHEIGLSLHGTYGWPVIPGSTLKGLSAAWAVASGADAAGIRRVLGTPRADLPATREGPPPGLGQPHVREATATRGTVCFLDAIPAGRPVKVAVDVLTPHARAYYETTQEDSERVAVPPAEYHNPVPVNFLTVSGAFAVDLYGRDRADVERAAEWLIRAGEELGAGGKTGAGYGFLTISGVPAGEGPA